MAERLNCWEYAHCGREPGAQRSGEMDPCPAATDATYDGLNGGRNAGRFCWAVSGTLCDGKTQGTYARKQAQCRQCPFFRRVRVEEGCHFQLLKPGLGTADPNVLHGRLNDVVRLMTVCRDVFASLAVRPLLARITEHAAALTHSAAGAYLLDTAAGQLRLEAAAGTMPLPEAIPLENDSPVASAVRRRCLTRGHVAPSDRTDAPPLIAMPIGGEQHPVGVLVLVKGEREFSTDDEWFLREFALMAGLGIGNSHLIGSLRDLREVDKAKSRFMALLLHEIGSPLATIACSLKALLEVGDDLSDEERTRLIDCSLDRVGSITALSAKLLDLGAIRASGYLADLQPVDVARVLREEVRARTTQARQADLAFALHIPDEQAVVQADPEGLRLIFANLLDNAIKYSAGKGRRVQVRLAGDGENVRLCVRDEGIGIPADQRDRLFEEFRRADNAAASGAGGFGLGPAFVKELIDRYGGQIELESELGEGTSVTVSFPLSPEAPAGGAGCEAIRERT